MTTEPATLSTTYSGVIRALAWVEEELFICTEEELHREFQHRMNCQFSGDKTQLIFADDKARWWFKARWK
jgi:hypothetical protein